MRQYLHSPCYCLTQGELFEKRTIISATKGKAINSVCKVIYLLLQVPTIFFTSVYYEKKELLEDPVNDSGRRELHVRFTTKEYPLIMRAMREMRSKNPVIFKDIPEDDTELKAAKQYVTEDETDEDEMCEEEEEEYEYEEGEEEEPYEDVE